MADSRTVRIFLSSTFRDFGEERDLLVRRVFPALRAKLKDRFVELVDVDLRWGITAEQAERGEVLPICLTEIDRSRPYFIGLLGERYGWVPEKGKYSPNLLRQRRWLREHQGGKSVTELEILHGVLNDPKMAGRARFYVRSTAYARKKGKAYLAQDAEDRRRQQALKARVRASGFPVLRYGTPRDLARRLEKDLWALLDAEFPASAVPDAFERERMRHEAYAAPRRRLYLGGREYVRTLRSLLRRNTPRILITGQSGGGKSALLANALQGLASPKRHLFEHYLGASSDAADPVALVRRLIEFIRRVTGSTEAVPADPQELFDSLPTWLAIASAYATKHRSRFVFVLDALNGLTAHRDLRWLPGYLPPRVQLVVSCLEGEVKAALEQKGPWETLDVVPLDRDAQQQLLAAYLRRYNKTLPPDLTTTGLAHPLARNPLWLKTLAEELRLFGSHEELATRLSTLLGSPKGKRPVEPPTVDDLFEHVLERIEQDQGPALLRDAMTALWASRAGLSEPELLEILAKHAPKKATRSLPPALWAPIRHALDEILLESGGRLVFGHDYAKVAVRDRYLPTDTRQRSAHRSLARQFASQTVDARVAEELPHQWREARAWGELEKTLTDLAMFEALKAHRSDEEHLGYWLSLEAVRGRQIMEPRLKAAWQRWRLPKTKEHTGDVADRLATFLRYAGRGLTGTFVRELAMLAAKVEANTYGSESPQAASRINSVGMLFFGAGDYISAARLLRKALTIIEKAQGAEHTDTGLWAGNLGALLHQMGEYPAAEPLLRRSAAVTEALFGPDHVETSISLEKLGLLLLTMGDHSGAEPLLSRALSIREQTLGLSHRLTGHACFNLGSLFKTAGDYSHADQLFRRALEIAERSGGPEHPETGACLNNLAMLLQATGDYAGAEPLFRRALTIAAKAQGAEHPDTGTSLNNLAGLLEATGDHTGAEPLYRRALAIAEHALGPEHPSTGTRLTNLASLLEAIGGYAAAEPLYWRALAIAEKAHGPRHSDTGTALWALGNCLESAGKPEQAREALERELAITQANQGKDSASAALTQHAIGKLLRALERSAAAQERFAEAVRIYAVQTEDHLEALEDSLEELVRDDVVSGRFDEAIRQLTGIGTQIPRNAANAAGVQAVLDRRVATLVAVQASIAALLEKGREQGFLVYEQVNEALPEDVVEESLIEGVVAALAAAEIFCYEEAPFD
jgi:nephrocystin-3